MMREDGKELYSEIDVQEKTQQTQKELNIKCLDDFILQVLDDRFPYATVTYLQLCK